VTILATAVGAGETQGGREALIERAASAYSSGAFAQAADLLCEVPGLLGVVPALDRLDARARTQVFFDLGRCHLAAGDTASARVVLRHMYGLGWRGESGVLHVPPDDALQRTREYVTHLRILDRQAALDATSPWVAAGRSALIPGWGQSYRGRPRRGRVLLASSAALALAWYVADRAYQRSERAYRATSRSDLRLYERTGHEGDPRPFETRFSRLRSRAVWANAALGALASVWTFGIVENFVVAPGKASIQIAVGTGKAGRTRATHGEGHGSH